MKTFLKFRKTFSFIIFLPYIFIFNPQQLNYFEQDLTKTSSTKKTRTYKKNEYFNYSSIEQISFGDEFSGAIINGKTSDHLYMWGANDFGQLGLGSSDDAIHSIPKEVTTLPDGDIKQIALGNNHSAAVVNYDGLDHLYTWGKNDKGQLGLDNNTNYNTPQEVVELPENNIEQVALGDDYSAAIVNDETIDHLYTWGNNGFGQLGLDNTTNNNTPQEVIFKSREIKQISLGSSHSAAIVNDGITDKLYTWGNNDSGQLGLEDENTYNAPQEVTTLPEGNIEQVSLGGFHSAAIVNDGENDHLYTWGKNDKGQLGLGETGDYNTPQEVPVFAYADFNIKQVELGYSYSAAVVNNGISDKLYTWGNNDCGQLGYQSTPNENFQPHEIESLPSNDIKQIALGNNHSSLILNDGSTDFFYAWGSNEKGQLGFNETSFKSINTPQLVWKTPYLTNIKTSKKLSSASNYQDVTIHYEFKTNIDVKKVEISLFESKTSNHLSDGFTLNLNHNKIYYSDEIIFSNLEKNQKYYYEVKIYYCPISEDESNEKSIVIATNSFKNNFWYHSVWFPFAIIILFALLLLIFALFFLLFLRNKRIVISKK